MEPKRLPAMLLGLLLCPLSAARALHVAELASQKVDGSAAGAGALHVSLRAAQAGAGTEPALAAAQAGSDDPCGPESSADYDLHLHIAAVAILLGVSLLGSLAPVVLHLSSKSEAVTRCVRLGTFFGFGTILSTAFIHMMLPAAEALSSPCLPASFTDSYSAWAYLFVSLAVMFMHLVDYVLKGQYQRRSAQQQQQQYGSSEDSGSEHGSDEHGCHGHHTAVIGAIKAKDLEAQQRRRKQQQQQLEDAEAGEASSSSQGCDTDAEDACSVLSTGCQSPLLKHKRDASQIVGIYLTEAGIIFHSVMIGLTLGVTAGAAFKTLLVALSVHQFFEGFAIGSAAVDSGIGAARSAIMGLVYSLTTPIGIAIGIGVRASFNQNAARTLLASGVCDSLSTGILIYVVLVDLVTPMMTESPWLRKQSWQLQALSFGAFYAGAGTMAALGKWL